MAYRFVALCTVLVAFGLASGCSVVNAPEEAVDPAAGGQGNHGAGQPGGGQPGGGGAGGSTACTSVTTLTDCGACGVPCQPANASGATCATGSCDYGSCSPGFDDCDGVRANGCEADFADPASCGSCDQDCAAVGFAHVASLTCQSGVCGWLGCEGGWDDCDGLFDSGCEQVLDTLEHCGACNTPCTPENVQSPNCAGQICGYDVCTGDFQDCDGNGANGCESNRLDDELHCGDCSTACTGAEQCVGGGCSSCTPEQRTIDIPFSQTTGWLATGCCSQPNYRVGQGPGSTINGSFADPVGTDGTISSVQVVLGVRHSCNAGAAMQLRLNSTNIGTWGSADGPHCDCSNLNVAVSTNNAPPSSYQRGGQNVVSVVHQADGTCHEAIESPSSLPAGTAFRVIVNKTCP